MAILRFGRYGCQADNGRTYTLDSALKPLKEGERYQIVSASETKQQLGSFLADNAANTPRNTAGLTDVLRNSPTGQQWDFKNTQLTGQERRTNLFEYEDGSLYHADYIGNLAWAFIMASYGYSPLFSMQGAGLYQTYQALRGRTGFGSVWSFGDDPRDTEAIAKGYLLWYSTPKEEHLFPQFQIQ